jgi:hypothetical protein
LGVYSGKKIWLEAASFDCGWYWGFGYLEQYTNENCPSKSKDITLHTHYNSLLFCNQSRGKFAHILNDVDGFSEVTLSEKEQWELSDLIKSYYTLKGAAEFFHRGNSQYTSGAILNFKNKEIEDKINQKILPQIFNRIYEILTP